MSHTWSESEGERHVARLDSFADTMKSDVAAKVAESPNILVYGLLCSGVVGWWMQLAQSDAQRLVRSSGAAFDYVRQGMQDVVEVYRVTEEGHSEAARRVGDIAEQLG